MSDMEEMCIKLHLRVQLGTRYQMPGFSNSNSDSWTEETYLLITTTTSSIASNILVLNNAKFNQHHSKLIFQPLDANVKPLDVQNVRKERRISVYLMAGDGDVLFLDALKAPEIDFIVQRMVVAGDVVLQIAEKQRWEAPACAQLMVGVENVKWMDARNQRSHRLPFVWDMGEVVFVQSMAATRYFVEF